MSSPNPLIWLDMEMTGLDPATCVPIEVAVIVTDQNLNELAMTHGVIHQPASAFVDMVDVVRKMHTDNGLLDRVAASTSQLASVEAAMCELVSRFVGEGEGILAGNSIHTDRRFIAAYFPEFEKLLHYRMVDVSSIKELATRWYDQGVLFKKPDSDHTALADARGSIAELSHYRSQIFRRP